VIHPPRWPQLSAGGGAEAGAGPLSISSAAPSKAQRRWALPIFLPLWQWEDGRLTYGCKTQKENTMKTIALLCLFLAATVTIVLAENKNNYENDHDHRADLELRYVELSTKIFKIQNDFERHLIQKDQIIFALEDKIKLFESDLFQTTQSLRNLELEVWDLKDSSASNFTQTGSIEQPSE
jgi:hypothetical protein